ncbi:efflux RND transporter periplasmic adaptor subunit [Microbulbifer sp. S227A]|uniref:efflux RND transporter periplasmic adaptor subunit n=1 Tax=Microbulbifer sp. S227A TaxID=3415131 RepID=UPI003C7BEF8E
MKRVSARTSAGIAVKTGAAILIVAASYVLAFGIPAPLSGLFGQGIAGNADQTAATPDSPRRRGGTRATAVVLGPLAFEPYEDVLRAVGSARAQQRADVTATTSGEVTHSNLSANSIVKAGDVLVQLDARTEELNLQIALAELEQASDTVDRYERLNTNGNSTITDVSLAEAHVAERLARAKVGLAQVALDDRSVRAPISGRLGLSDVEVGDIIAANSVLATVDNADTLLVEFELPERSIGALSRQHEILVSTPSLTGRVFAGEIVSHDSRIDSQTRSVTVKARVDNPEGLLWPGMTFSVRTIEHTEPMPVVPATAITWSRTGSTIWVAEDGGVRQVPVTILFRRNARVWIDADLPADAMIVTEGAQKLHAGSAIAPVTAPQSDTPRDALPNLGSLERPGTGTGAGAGADNAEHPA